MRTKLFALALAAMLTIGTGAVIAADSVSPAGAQPVEHTDNSTTRVDDDRSPTSSDKTYDEKLTADEHVDLEPSMIAPRGEGVVEFSMQESTESDWTEVDSTTVEGPTSSTAATRNATVYDEKLTAEESVTVDLREEDVEMTVFDSDSQYDKTLTADEHVTLQPGVIEDGEDGLVVLDFQEPTTRTVPLDSETGTGTVTVETEEEA